MGTIFKKNQVIITALAIMIAVAGYLQFAGEETMVADGTNIENGTYQIIVGQMETEDFSDLSEEDFTKLGKLPVGTVISYMQDDNEYKMVILDRDKKNTVGIFGLENQMYKDFELGVFPNDYNFPFSIKSITSGQRVSSLSVFAILGRLFPSLSDNVSCVQPYSSISSFIPLAVSIGLRSCL